MLLHSDVSEIKLFVVIHGSVTRLKCIFKKSEREKKYFARERDRSKKSLSRSTSCLTFCALKLIFTIGCFFGKSSLIEMQGPEERCGTFISFELRQIASLQDLLDKTATGCLNWLWLLQRWLISWKVFFYPEAHFWHSVPINMGKGHKIPSYMHYRSCGKREKSSPETCLEGSCNKAQGWGVLINFF